MIKNRKCKHCNEIKKITEFYKNKSECGGFNYYCKICMRTIGKKYKIERVMWNKEHKDSVNMAVKKWQSKHPEQIKAERKLNTQIKNGKIKRKCCVICKEIKTCGHHLDYKKPLLVIWLCSSHHRQVHTKEISL
jgi:hypothetical protein